VWQFLENYAKGDAPPRILLTHIPLYRAEGTSCGPLRESSNPIHVGKGYQYQNVLTPDLSSRIVDIVRPLAVFSGDDHDYCFVQHNYGGMKIPEHTIKSFSWAMVRSALLYLSDCRVSTILDSSYSHSHPHTAMSQRARSSQQHHVYYQTSLIFLSSTALCY